MVSIDVAVFVVALTALTIETVELAMDIENKYFEKAYNDRYGKSKREVVWNQIEAAPITELFNNTVGDRLHLDDYVIARKRRSPRPINVFNEILDAWQWLNTPITEDEIHILERLSSGSPATQEDLNVLFDGFQGDGEIMHTRNSKPAKNRIEPRAVPQIDNKFTNSSFADNEQVNEHVIARRKRSPKPVHVFNEVLDAWQWLNTPISDEEIQILERISSGSPATQDDIDKLFGDFYGDGLITQTGSVKLNKREVKLNKSQPKSREKRFIKEFINALINPNGRLPSSARGINVNSDANWSPRIPTVLSPPSGREGQSRQNLHGGYGNSHSSPYFNEYDSDVHKRANEGFNEFSTKIKSNDAFDENAIRTNEYFNEYSNSNGRIHQRWFDF